MLTVRRKTRGSEDGTRKTAEFTEEDDEVTFNPETVSNIVENGSISNCDDANSFNLSKFLYT